MVHHGLLKKPDNKYNMILAIYKKTFHYKNFVTQYFYYKRGLMNQESGYSSPSIWPIL